MKKAILVLCSLLAVTTGAYAKEVAQQVIPEKIEKPKFRPSGYLSLQYKVYGDTEGQNDDSWNHDTWNRGYNDYSRLQTYFSIQATEKFKIQGRIRDYNNIERNNSQRDNKINGTDTRLRFYYEHNDFFTSRLEYRDYTSGTQKYEYQARLSMYENEGGLLSSVLVAPKIAYYYNDNGVDGYFDLGANIEYAGNLPWGFTWDGTLYLDQNFYNNSISNYTDGEPYMEHYRTFDDEFTVTWEIYLYRTWKLYENDKTTVELNFDGGYDPYKFRHYTRYAYDKDTKQITKLGKNTYSLYGALTLGADYKVTEYLTVNGGVGAEYRNWSNEWQSSAKDWRWQPFAYAGMKVVF